MTKSLPPKSLVLYADDDPDDLHLVKKAFEKYNHSVELKTFDDGIGLLNYLKDSSKNEHHPCLIILDINMPKKNGKEILRDVRSMDGFEEVPIVLFSTSNLPSEIAFARAFNAGFITKPLYTEQIFHLVDQMIDHCTDEIKNDIRGKK